jgi:hypothetical protein
MEQYIRQEGIEDAEASRMAVEMASMNLPKTASRTLMVGCLVSRLESKKVQ